MSYNIIKKASALWNNDKIRVLVMLSLTLQMVLIFFAPLRKRSGNKKLLILLWLSYLGADYVATLALGSLLTNRFLNAGAELTEQSLTAFWAPFLLLHLGGPDNITSYSAEDNELWLRHLLGFVVQVYVALVVLVLSMLQTTRLLVPSILIFIVGTIKFGERTLALRCASTDQIKKPDGQLMHLMLTYTGSIDKPPDAQSKGEVLDISDAKFIRLVYCYFLIFKPHIVGTLVSNTWRLHHLRMLKEDIDFKFIGIQLSFFYDILHTKATLVHCIAFHVIRIASLVAMVIAFFFFHITEKRGYEISDLIITYILLSVALFLEFYSALHLVLSKWMTISLLRLNKKGAIKIANFISKAKNYIFCCGNKGQWSGRMGQHSLIQAVMKDQESNWLKKAWDFLFGGEESVEVPSILEKTVIKHVENLVKPVKHYEEYMDLLRKIRSSWIMNTLDRYNLTEIKNEVKEQTFEQCVMAWHMVTDICYFTTNNAPGDSEEGQMREALYRVSNYMMYLLFERTSMMPPGIADIAMDETHFDCSFLRGNSHRDNKQARCYLYIELRREVNGIIRSGPGDNSRSVIALVRVLLENLTELAEESEERLWEVIRDAWMEILTYSALHCSQREHAKGLSRGGELLTHYWLLMAHYGIMDEYNAVTRAHISIFMNVI